MNEMLLKQSIHIQNWVIKQNLDKMKSIKLNTILMQKFKKEKQWLKNLEKFTAAFDHFDKNLIVLSAASGGISIICFTYIIVVIVGIASASFSLIFSLTTGVIKKLLKITINKKKKHNKILFSSKKVK